MPTHKAKVGIVTTWGTHCGLATYASYLTEQFGHYECCILAEHPWNQQSLESNDELPVTYCWQRENGDYDALVSAVEQAQIQILFLNCHYRFFEYPSFNECLTTMRERGVKVVATLHQVFTVCPELTALVTNVDQVVVHTEQNKLEVIANGGQPASTHVIPHGVVSLPERSESDRISLKAQLGIPIDSVALACFGFVQPHKGIEGMLEAVAYLQKKGVQAHGYMVGTIPSDAPGASEYRQNLSAYAQSLGVSDRVHFLDRFVSEQEVQNYLQAVDIVLMNYLSEHYEVSGACSRAVGAGAVVLASCAPAFEAFNDAIWRVSDSQPLSISCERILNNSNFYQYIRSRSKAYCEAYSWQVVAARYAEVFDRLLQIQSFNSTTKKEIAVEKQNANLTSNGMKVLFRNRPNMFTQRGGDTVVVEKTVEKLRELGVEAVIDEEGKEDISNFDLVHLFNFTLPELVRQQAQAAQAANVPFVVTTLNEDVPSFHNQSHAVSAQLVEYVGRGQDEGWYQAHKVNVGDIPGCAMFDNSWTAQNAAMLFSCGPAETELLQKYYPTARISEARFAHELPEDQSKTLFVDQYGLDEFILCVGRLESRKNQLQLLKALEHVDIPVVLIAGAFSYQREYAEAVRSFKRKGQTLILDHVSNEMLASAYNAAKVHVLPSWFEFPGLVSLEAAYFNCNVVVSDTGTTADYFGDTAWYCDPSDEHTILHAVLAAYHSAIRPELRNIALSNHDWRRTASIYKRTYEAILNEKTSSQAIQSDSSASLNLQVGSYDEASHNTALMECIERGEIAAREKEYNFAHDLFDQALSIDSTSVRALRGKGAMHIAEGHFERALEYMERAYAVDARDPKTLSGLGMCKSQAGDLDTAYDLFVRALEIENAHLVTMLQLIDCAYKLDRYDDLIRILDRYVAGHQADLEMKYCLAGALYKNQRHADSKRVLNEILEAKPDHLGSQQLQEAIASEERQEQQESLSNKVDVESSSKEGQPSAPASFDSVDNRIVQLEEAKRLRKLDEARHGCEQLLDRSGLREDQYERTRLLYAEVRILQGELEESAEIYDSVLEQSPKSVRALCGKGALAANSNQWEAAFLLFSEAVNYEPEYDVALAGLGVCALNSQDDEKAWAYFTKALDSNAENLRALLGVIDVGYRLKRLDKVQAAIEVYLDMHPADLDMVYSLAGCLFARDRLDEAKAELDKITLFEPENERAHELLRIIDERQSGNAASGAA